jgi:hypothetical protein
MRCVCFVMEASLQAYERIGETATDPKWAIAWKPAPAEAVTQVEDVVLSVGRTGVSSSVTVNALHFPNNGCFWCYGATIARNHSTQNIHCCPPPPVAIPKRLCYLACAVCSHCRLTPLFDRRREPSAGKCMTVPHPNKCMLGD